QPRLGEPQRQECPRRLRAGGRPATRYRQADPRHRQYARLAPLSGIPAPAFAYTIWVLTGNGKNRERDVADERLCNPISTQELERRWKAVRAAMPEAKLDALIVQGANNMCGTGGYFRWFTGVSMATSYPATVIFPKDALMTLVSHGPIGAERDLNGN